LTAIPTGRIVTVLGVLLALFAPAPAPVQAQETYDQEMARLAAGMPKDVADYIPRLAGCIHWGGEYSEDPVRAKQIADAMSELGCDTLDADEATLQARYKGNPAVKQRLDEVRGTYGEGD
jgi:hypothetical protein